MHSGRCIRIKLWNSKVFNEKRIRIWYNKEWSLPKWACPGHMLWSLLMFIYTPERWSLETVKHWEFCKAKKVCIRTSGRLEITFSQRLNQINWDFPEILTCEKKIPGNLSLIIIGLIRISFLKTIWVDQLYSKIIKYDLCHLSFHVYQYTW